MLKRLFYLMLSAIVLGACGKHGSDDPVEPDKEVLTLDKHRFEVPAEGRTFSVKVTGNVEYTVTVAETCRTWLQESSAQAVDQTHIFKVAKHEVPKGREGYVVFDGGTVKDTVYVFQVAGVGADFTETVAGASFEMVYVKGGTFNMGATDEQKDVCSDNEKPVHQVTLSDYYMAICPVTQALWQRVMGTTIEQQRDKYGKDADLYGKGDNYPIYYVSWEEAVEFCTNLSKLTNKKYVLPTEAQWEYAARGGTKGRGYRYSGSNELRDVASLWDGKGEKTTFPVAQKKPNELGIYDMSGNVWEWCLDWYGDYNDVEQTNPVGPMEGTNRVLRGGSWNSFAGICRISTRNCYGPARRLWEDGFRVALLP